MDIGCHWIAIRLLLLVGDDVLFVIGLLLNSVESRNVNQNVRPADAGSMLKPGLRAALGPCDLMSANATDIFSQQCPKGSNRVQ